MYPCLGVNLAHLQENVQTVAALCAGYGIGITGVTKAFRGDPEIARAYLDGGVRTLGDSRVENLRRMEGLEAEKWLIRPPMLSEAQELARYGDASLNSELVTVQAVAAASARLGKRHKIILMADLGDIREGYVDYGQLVRDACVIDRTEGAELYGLGVNLTCFSFIQSDPEKMGTLLEISRKVEEAVGHKLAVVSGGNSATIHLMMQGGIPAGINNLRLGESLLFGKERARYRFLPGTHNDVFTLECEIVELKEKPSLPWGQVGVDSYGRSPVFTDRGPCRQKAICALGKQDFDPETTVPVDPGVELLGASSDHLMLDVTESPRQYRVGDVVKLRLGYFSTMRAFTSEYVKKSYQG